MTPLQKQQTMHVFGFCSKEKTVVSGENNKKSTEVLKGSAKNDQVIFKSNKSSSQDLRSRN